MGSALYLMLRGPGAGSQPRGLKSVPEPLPAAPRPLGWPLVSSPHGWALHGAPQARQRGPQARGRGRRGSPERPRLGGKVSGLRCRDRVWTEAGLQLHRRAWRGLPALQRGWGGAVPGSAHVCGTCECTGLLAHVGCAHVFRLTSLTWDSGGRLQGALRSRARAGIGHGEAPGRTHCARRTRCRRGRR